MKVGLLLLISAAVLGGLVGTLMLRDPGYVMLAYGGRVMETSFWFAAAMLIVLYAILRVLMLVLVRLFQGRSLLDAWQAKRSDRDAQRQTVRGLLLLAEGQWTEAQRLLTGAAQRAATPLVNYLHAAEAAHKLGDAAGRDELLARAEQTTAGSAAAVLLTRAELQMAEGQWQNCRATLLELREQSPRHPLMLDMLRRCHEHLHDWPAVIELLPDLRKAGSTDIDSITALERSAWVHRLGRDDHIEVWRLVPKGFRRDPELVAARAKRILADGEPGTAERMVRKSLDRDWHGQLIDLYGQIPSPNLARQLAAAERWLQDHPDDAALMLALGRIAMMHGAWSKAREYMEASLGLEPSDVVHGELGRLLTHLGEFIRGSEHLGKACKELPNLPLPPRPE